MFNMFVFRRKHKLNLISCVYAHNVTSKRKHMPYLLNLKGSRSFSNHGNNDFLKEMITDSNTRKYINFIVNEYQKGDLRNNSAIQDVDFESLSVILDERIKKLDDIKNLHELVKGDVEMKSLANEEKSLYERDLKELDVKLLDTILKDSNELCNTDIVVEIQAGVGGHEATLFVSDLYNMYIGYMKYLGLSHEVIECDKVSQGGYRHVSVSVSGDQAFEKLKYEGGVHRVQRIPITEKAGRLHTSTASVAIIPDLLLQEVKLNHKDLKIETKRSSGAGGQHVNCTDSAVRIVHIPTGTVVTNETDRSQIKNREKALTKLKTLLYKQSLQKQTIFCDKLRKRQLGLGMRNEKIRTYNFNQDRITDHRLENGTVYNIKDFLKGGRALEELENRLDKHMKKEQLLDIMKEIEYLRT